MSHLTKEQFLSGKKFRYNLNVWDKLTYVYEPPKAHETWSNGNIIKYEDGLRGFHACVHSVTDEELHIYLNVLSKSVDVIFKWSELEAVEEKEVVK